MANLRGWEWLIIVALILLLFGAKRLPDAARGLGRSLRIFKTETKGLTDSDESSADVKPTNQEQPKAVEGATSADSVSSAATVEPTSERTEK